MTLTLVSVIEIVIQLPFLSLCYFTLLINTLSLCSFLPLPVEKYRPVHLQSDVCKLEEDAN